MKQYDIQLLEKDSSVVAQERFLEDKLIGGWKLISVVYTNNYYFFYFERL